MAEHRRTETAAAARQLVAEPLTAAGFAPFGDVIESAGEATTINQGMGQRFADLAALDVHRDHGRPAIHRVHARAEQAPVALRLMERHPLSSQAFVPVDGQRYLVVVAPAGEPPAPTALRAFVAAGRQGINYHRGVWHHPLIALDVDADFVELARVGPGRNCDEAAIGGDVIVSPGA